jgi:hypothetical protein
MISLMVPPRRSAQKEEGAKLVDTPCGGFAKSIGCLMTPIVDGYIVQWQVLTPSDNLQCRIRIASSIYYINKKEEIMIKTTLQLNH